MNTRDTILDILQASKRALPVTDLITGSGRSRVSVQKAVKQLVLTGILTRLGTPPRVYYQFATTVNTLTPHTTPLILEPNLNTYLEDHFTNILPNGHEETGVRAFTRWCNDRGLADIASEAHKFRELNEKFNKLSKNGVIDATVKLVTTFNYARNLDHLYFLYPYSIPVYGKTRIGQWLFICKQTQNSPLMQRVLSIVVPIIRDYIANRGYSAVAFVPPTVPRKIQFMELLRRELQVTLEIPIIKLSTPIRVPQKTLKELGDRILNAESTFTIPLADRNLDSVLIIDDFTGSGSTLNILARMIKQQNIAKIVDGLTITGSMNGFEVIKEV